MLTLIDFLEEIDRQGGCVVLPAPEVERLAKTFGSAVRGMGHWNKTTDGAIEIPIANITEALKQIGNGDLGDAIRQLRSPEEFAAVIEGSSSAKRLIERLAEISDRQFVQMVERFQDSNDPTEVDRIGRRILWDLFE